MLRGLTGSSPARSACGAADELKGLAQARLIAGLSSLYRSGPVRNPGVASGGQATESKGLGNNKLQFYAGLAIDLHLILFYNTYMAYV